MEDRKIRVAITHGDTNSTGYEELFKVFAEPEILELCTPIIYGSPKVAAYHRKALDMQAAFSIIANAEEACDGRVNLLASFDEEVKVDLGQPTQESGEAALKAVDRAMEDYGRGLFDVLVTSPVCNSCISAENRKFNGHTQYLKSALAVNDSTMTMFVSESLRVGLVTTHMSLTEAVNSITKELVADKIRIMHHSLKRDFRISNPRIAVLALNPATGTAGLSETEGNEAVSQAISELSEQGIRSFGPYAADEFFGRGEMECFDAVLAMYYDQGAIPFKLIADNQAVYYTTGLPLVRTAPGHDVAFDTAGQDKADENQLRQAIYLAIDILRNRAMYDEPMGNPLPKLYREKRDDSEKVRFAIPKKREQKA